MILLLTGSAIANRIRTGMEKGGFRKFITAFMLSPGVIFALAYLALWSSTNMYLERTFRDLISQSFDPLSGSRYQLDVASLQTGPELDSVTLKNLRLVPRIAASQERIASRAIRIEQLEISCPGIGLALFRPARAGESSRKICLALLSRCEEVDRSVNHQSAPSPAN